VCVCVYVCVFECAFVHACVCMSVNCMPMCVLYAYVHAHRRTHTHTHTYTRRVQKAVVAGCNMVGKPVIITVRLHLDCMAVRAPSEFSMSVQILQRFL